MPIMWCTLVVGWVVGVGRGGLWEEGKRSSRERAQHLGKPDLRMRSKRRSRFTVQTVQTCHSTV